jgi:hypothetical protein
MQSSKSSGKIFARQMSARFHGPVMRLGLTFAIMTLVFWPLVGAQAQPNPATDYNAWPVLQKIFPSTGGGGIMIHGYDPVVSGQTGNQTCTTDFQAVTPEGTIYRSEVSFDAVPIQNGILCTNGRWRAKDGGNSGTTPYEVFIKDGVRRGSP